jgi:hypothetical protein
MTATGSPRPRREDRPRELRTLHLRTCHGVGRDINVQCVLIKEMIIIVDHYTLAVRNRR